MPVFARLCLLLGATGLAACATRIDVQSIGAPEGVPVYELRGHRLAGLQAQAQALCPAGYDVLRQWQRDQAADPQAGPAAKAWTWLSDSVAPGEQDASQLLVQCQPGSTASPTAP